MYALYFIYKRFKQRSTSVVKRQEEPDWEDTDTQEQTPQSRKEKQSKPRRSRLVAWNRSKVKDNDRNGRWDDEGDN